MCPGSALVASKDIWCHDVVEAMSNQNIFEKTMIFECCFRGGALGATPRCWGVRKTLKKQWFLNILSKTFTKPMVFECVLGCPLGGGGYCD